ncbi:MAG: hypothetical protein LJE95_07340 [Acidobacteria bacterium]|jgi:hypothetical protein|nr:hypothetical protein [Acidobacteriota bacterium]
MSRYFMLRDGKVVEAPDHATWAGWYESSYEKVREVIRTETVHATVTTQFLPISMTLSTQEQPLLFETRVSGGWLNGQGDRFPDMERARDGHKAWVERVRAFEEENELPPPGAGW